MMPSPAVAPETARLADELAKRLGERPLRPSELAAELAGGEAPPSLIEALDAALSRVAARDEQDRLDEAVWGEEPTDQRLAEAHRASYGALEGAMREALADALTREQAAHRLGITPQAVSKRIASGALVALRRGRVSRLPAWQFYEDRVLPELSELIAAYPGGALALTCWANSSSPELDGLTPAQALTRRGWATRVVEAARTLTPATW